MSQETQTQKVAFIATDGVEDVELTKPWQAVEDAGYQPVLISPADGEIQGYDHVDKSQTHHVDQTIKGANPGDYTALVLPGGVINGDALRTDETVVKFIQQFNEDHKPIAAICHGLWAMIEAGAIEGHKITSWPSLQTDLRNAGGTWENEELVEDDNLITSRKPDDLPAFCKALVSAIEAGDGSSASGGSSSQFQGSSGQTGTPGDYQTDGDPSTGGGDRYLDDDPTRGQGSITQDPTSRQVQGSSADADADPYSEDWSDGETDPTSSVRETTYA